MQLEVRLEREAKSRSESSVERNQPASHMRLHEVPKLEVYDQVCPLLQRLPLAGLPLFLFLQPLDGPLPPPLVLRISLLCTNDAAAIILIVIIRRIASEPKGS
jgi:hypothetical protein